MRRPSFVGMALLALIKIAYAGSDEILTVDGGVACLSPYRLSEGIAAANKGDNAWMAEKGCLRLKGDLPATKINLAAKIGKLDEWWQVRVHAPNGGVTVWAYAQSFKTVAGKQFPNPRWMNKK